MTLYEIDKEIERCLDSETGEVLDIERLEALEIDREHKIESVALWIKDLRAEAEALKAEKDAFAARQKHVENKIESLKGYLLHALEGNKFKTTLCEVSFRPSKTVEVDEALLPKKFFTKKVTYAVNKQELKELLGAGNKIKGAWLEDHLNPQIK